MSVIIHEDVRCGNIKSKLTAEYPRPLPGAVGGVQDFLDGLEKDGVRSFGADWVACIRSCVRSGLGYDWVGRVYIPIEFPKSNGPTNRTSTPSTAAISLTFSRASLVSI